MIPVAKPFLDEQEVNAVAAVLRSGMLAQGSRVEALEREFASYCGAAHGIALNSGTAALHAVLTALGIRPGHEVIVPAFTFYATASAVCMCGARPVFADVDEATFNISVGSVQELLSQRTRAVVGVHLFGQPFEVRSIHELCEERGITLVEDAAQAHGAAYHGKRAGGLCEAGCFSFYPTKNMTTGEGGMVTTGDAALARKVRLIINHGQEEKYLHTSLGYNFRMTDIAAAIGLVQLQKLDGFNRRRQENASYYDRAIRRDGIVTPAVMPGMTHVYHQYVLKVTGELPITRDELAVYLREKGIGTAVHYPIPLTRQPYFAECARPNPCPVAESLAGSVISLPVHPQVSDADRELVARVINGVP